MSESETLENGPEYVPGFVYLDMDLIKSLSARMGGGYIKEQIENRGEFEEASESLRAKLMASIFNVGLKWKEKSQRQKVNLKRSNQ